MDIWDGGCEEQRLLYEIPPNSWKIHYLFRPIKGSLTKKNAPVFQDYVSIEKQLLNTKSIPTIEYLLNQ